MFARTLMLLAVVGSSALASSEEDTWENPPSTRQTSSANSASTAAADAERGPGHPILVRFGADGSIGYFTPGSALAFAPTGRVGVQFTPSFGLYADVGYMAGLGLGVNLSAGGGGVSASGVGYFHVGALAEGDFGTFFIAGGPMVADGGWGQVGQSVDNSGNVSQYAVAVGGVMPGLDLRTGFNFGNLSSSGRRTGFSMGVELLGLLGQATSVGQAAGGSGASQQVKVGQTIVGVNPVVFFGFESW